MKNQAKKMLSVIVPVKDEEGSLPPFYKELTAILTELHMSYELIFIDDGSVDKSLQIIQNFQKKNRNIKIIKFRGNFGKSA
ncbi:MAG TPA: glycosyltransferase, partial [Patescibacteria group bacterium]